MKHVTICYDIATRDGVAVSQNGVPGKQDITIMILNFDCTSMTFLIAWTSATTDHTRAVT